MIHSVCVYCGSSPGRNPLYLQTAREFGNLLAEANLTLVYGGGQVGMMGAVADGALEAKGKVTGIIPTLLCTKELAHRGCTKLKEVETMHERKQLMADLSDAFVALPGGVGTLEELAEIITWWIIRSHDKPIFLVNTARYYDPLLALLKHMEEEEFLPARCLEFIQTVESPKALISRLSS